MTTARVDASPNLNDPGTWTPQKQRLAWFLAFLAVWGLAWAFWLEGEYTRWSHERDREGALRDEHAALVVRVKGLPHLIARKAHLEEEIVRLEMQLPQETEMEGLLRSIAAAGRARGLQFELFRPSPVQLQDGYAEVPVALRLVGAFKDMGGFIGDLARLPRIVTVHDLVLTPQVQVMMSDRPASSTSRLIVMEATLRTYRALDAHEVQLVKLRQDRSNPGPWNGAQHPHRGAVR